MVDIKTVFVLEDKLGFLCDSEWDGDSFSYSPIDAYQYDKPIQGGRGGRTYLCRKIELKTETFESHLAPEMKVHKKRGRIRYSLHCPRCRKGTKDYATIDSVNERFNLFKEEHICIVKTWRFVEED